MSWQEMERVRDHSQAKGYELLALMMIASRVNGSENKGSAFPSIDTLADDCNCTPRFAQKIVAGWRENPHDVYVSDGGGRKKCNLYIVLVGCSYAEVVRRLMINLQINATEAEKIAVQCGYEKGVSMDTLSVEKGEHYDSKRVNNGQQKGEQWTQTTSQCSPEKELEKELLEKEPEEKEFSFSSPLPVDPPQPIGEEKEVLKFPIPENDDFILALAEIMGAPLTGPASIVRDSRTTLRGYLRDLRLIDPEMTLDDLRRYPAYYALKKAPNMPFPSSRFLFQGWKNFKAWLIEQQPAADTIPVSGELPGVGWIYALPAYWQQIENGTPAGWYLEGQDEHGQHAQFIKQPDGTFARVEAVAQAS